MQPSAQEEVDAPLTKQVTQELTANTQTQMVAGEAHLESGCVLVLPCYFEYLLAGVLVS